MTKQQSSKEFKVLNIFKVLHLEKIGNLHAQKYLATAIPDLTVL
jgi:hypothetical protein